MCLEVQPAPLPKCGSTRGISEGTVAPQRAGSGKFSLALRRFEEGYVGPQAGDGAGTYAPLRVPSRQLSRPQCRRSVAGLCNDKHFLQTIGEACTAPVTTKTRTLQHGYRPNNVTRTVICT